MATETTNAIGVAKQYTTQPNRVYEQRLADVPLQWNVGVSRQNNMADITSLLGRYNSQRGEWKLQQAHADFQVAQSLAPALYGGMSEKDKKNLNTLAIASASGKFNTSESKYAVAVIDKLKGEDLMRQINSDYNLNVYQQSPLPADSQAERQRYDKYVSDRLNEFKDDMKENGYTVSNMTAFEMGTGSELLKSKERNEIRYDKDKEDNTRLEVSQLLSSMAQEEFSKFADMNVEEQSAIVDNVLNHYSITQSPDAKFNTANLSKIILTAVENGGIDTYEMLLKKKLPDGRSVMSIVDSRIAETSAIQAERVLMNGEYLKHSEALEKTQTLNAYKDYIKKNITSPTRQRLFLSEAPKAYQRMQIEKQQRELLRQQERIAASLRTQTVQNTVSHTSAILKALEEGVDGYQVGATAYTVPHSADELKGRSIDPVEFARLTYERLSVLLKDPTANAQKIGRIFTSPLIGKEAKNYIKDQLDTQLYDLKDDSLLVKDANGAYSQLPSAVRNALALYEVAPVALKNTIGETSMQAVHALSRLLKSHPNTALSTFNLAMQNLRTDATSYKNAFSRDGFTYAVSDLEEMKSVTLTPTNYNSVVYREVMDTAVFLHAAGRTAPQAMEEAKRTVLENYWSYHGTLLGKIEDTTLLPYVEGRLNAYAMNHLGANNVTYKFATVRESDTDYIISMPNGNSYTVSKSEIYKKAKEIRDDIQRKQQQQ